MDSGFLLLSAYPLPLILNGTYLRVEAPSLSGGLETPSIGAVHRLDIRMQIGTLPPIGFCIDILIEHIGKQL